MSKPVIESTVANVMCELISAASALNMEPDPIKEPSDDAVYLSELDSHAKHSLKHIQAAIISLQPILKSMMH